MELLQTDINHFLTVLPNLIKGASLTIQITFFSVFIGIIIGLFMGLAKISNKWYLKIPAYIYIEFIRGTPLFVQILLFYFGIPGLISQIIGSPYRVDAVLAGIIVIGINSGAYVAEIFRGGIQSVEKGQREAGRSLGMTDGQTMRYIILPQAFKRIIPPLGNEFIVLLKDTSLLATIGVNELTKQGQLYTSVTWAPFPTYIGVALVYLTLTLTISRALALLERRLDVK